MSKCRKTKGEALHQQRIGASRLFSLPGVEKRITHASKELATSSFRSRKTPEPEQRP
ncbi:MAG TPA: hypothetical protein VEH27_13690 [Methylomirabilota bacterium]|nr:hypothetical protein [Methylomirabilota bacterium]